MPAPPPPPSDDEEEEEIRRTEGWGRQPCAAPRRSATQARAAHRQDMTGRDVRAAVGRQPSSSGGALPLFTGDVPDDVMPDAKRRRRAPGTRRVFQIGELLPNQHGGYFAPGTSLLSCDQSAIHTIVVGYASGQSWDEICAAARHCRSTCEGWLKRIILNGWVVAPPSNHGGARVVKFGGAGRAQLLELVRTHKRVTLEFYAYEMGKFLGCSVSPGAVSYQLRKLGITVKVMWQIYAEALAPHVIAAVEKHMNDMCKAIAAQDSFTDRLVYIDVTPFNSHDFVRKRIRCEQGEFPAAVAPSDRGAHVDLMAGLNRTLGLVGYTPVKGHVNYQTIALWCQELLLPQLRPGYHIVIADGGSYWEKPGARAVLKPIFRAAGIEVFYLPPRSPWLNPIEKAFLWLKTRVQTDPSTQLTKPLTTILDVCDAFPASVGRAFVDHLYPRP